MGSEEDRVVDGGPSGNVMRMETVAGSIKGHTIKVAKAYANDTVGGGARSSMSRGKGSTERVLSDGASHQQGIIKATDKGRACAAGEREAPAQRVTAVNHGIYFIQVHCCQYLAPLM